MRILIQADGRVPCEPNSMVHDCVRLRFRSQPDDPRLDAWLPTLLRELMPRQAIDPSTVVLRTAIAETEVLVITEPTTLIPHRFTHRRHVALQANSLEVPDIDRAMREDVTRVCRWRSSARGRRHARTPRPERR